MEQASHSIEDGGQVPTEHDGTVSGRHCERAEEGPNFSWERDVERVGDTGARAEEGAKLQLGARRGESR